MTDSAPHPSLAERLEQQDFAAVRLALAEAHAAYLAAPCLASSEALVQVIGELESNEKEEVARRQVLAAWRDQAPDDPYASFCLAALHFRQAWRHRGGALAHLVSEADWQALREHCEQGRALAEHALAGGGPAGHLLVWLMWEQQVIGTQHQAELIFNRAQELDPHWLGCWENMICIKDPRWGGSEPEMRAILELGRQHFTDPGCQSRLEARFALALGGYLFRFQDDHAGALALLEPARELQASDHIRASIQEECAWCYQAQGRPEQALAAWVAAAELYPVGLYYWQAYQQLRYQLDRPEAALACLEEGSACDDDEGARCTYALGLAWRDREMGLERDMGKSRQYLEKAIRQYQDLDNEEMLAWCYDGLGFCYLFDPALRDVAQAIACFERAIALGLAQGYLSMANIYRCNEYGLEDQELANRWILKAGEAGHDQAFYQYVHRVVDDLGARADLDTKKDLLRQSAERGDPDALRRLAGLELHHGTPAEAEKLLWQAVQEDDELEDSRAAFALAYGLCNGWFGDRDSRRATEVLEHSIRKQHRWGQPCYLLVMLLSALSTHLIKQNWGSVKELRGVLENCLQEYAEHTLQGQSARRMLAVLPGSWLGFQFWGLDWKGLPQPGVPDNLWS